VTIALATCAELPDLDPDDRPLVEALAARGLAAVAAVWDEPAVDWRGHELVVLRSTWDYAERRDAFLRWAAGLPRVLNPFPVLEWNTDKAGYLADLARGEVPVVPTTILRPGDPFEPPRGPYVVKPSISAGGRSSGRFEGADGRALVARLHAEGRTAVVQPFLPEAETRGEAGLVYLGGRFSHAVRRLVPLPAGGATTAELYLEETVEPADATEQERAVAEAALSIAPLRGELLYARVDLLHDAAGRALVNELELTEPSLYLAHGEGAAERLADSIAAAVATT
jgi:glutathione synthase/RimK-type ligase-like ATP-grasp enzyme